MMRVLNRTFGPDPVESITTEDIERRKTTLIAERRLSNRTLQKYLVVLNGIFKRAVKVWRLPRNPAAEVERPRLTRPAATDVFSREEVMALVRAAENEQEAHVAPQKERDHDFGVHHGRERQAEAEGLDAVFRQAGFEWRDAGCSMCLGMNPDILGPGERCASTSNRNFEGRQGSGGRTHLVSPPMAAAAAIAGHLVDVREFN